MKDSEFVACVRDLTRREIEASGKYQKLLEVVMEWGAVDAAIRTLTEATQLGAGDPKAFLPLYKRLRSAEDALRTIAVDEGVR